MPKAQPGQRKWKRLVRRSVQVVQAQIKTKSQLLAHLGQLAPEGDEVNGEAYAYIFQALAYLEEWSEQTAELQEILFQLWDITGEDEEP